MLLKCRLNGHLNVLSTSVANLGTWAFPSLNVKDVNRLVLSVEMKMNNKMVICHHRIFIVRIRASLRCDAMCTCTSHHILLHVSCGYSLYIFVFIQVVMAPSVPSMWYPYPKRLPFVQSLTRCLRGLELEAAGSHPHPKARGAER